MEEQLEHVRREDDLLNYIVRQRQLLQNKKQDIANQLKHEED